MIPECSTSSPKCLVYYLQPAAVNQLRLHMEHSPAPFYPPVQLTYAR